MQKTRLRPSASIVTPPDFKLRTGKRDHALRQRRGERDRPPRGGVENRFPERNQPVGQVEQIERRGHDGRRRFVDFLELVGADIDGGRLFPRGEDPRIPGGVGFRSDGVVQSGVDRGAPSGGRREVKLAEIHKRPLLENRRGGEPGIDADKIMAPGIGAVNVDVARGVVKGGDRIGERKLSGIDVDPPADFRGVPRDGRARHGQRGGLDVNPASGIKADVPRNRGVRNRRRPRDGADPPARLVGGIPGNRRTRHGQAPDGVNPPAREIGVVPVNRAVRHGQAPGGIDPSAVIRVAAENGRIGDQKRSGVVYPAAEIVAGSPRNRQADQLGGIRLGSADDVKDAAFPPPVDRDPIDIRGVDRDPRGHFKRRAAQRDHPARQRGIETDRVPRRRPLDRFPKRNDRVGFAPFGRIGEGVDHPRRQPGRPGGFPLPFDSPRRHGEKNAIFEMFKTKPTRLK